MGLVGVVTGIFTVSGLVRNHLSNGWMVWFLVSSVLTNVTGFLFPVQKILPSHIVAAIALVFLALAIFARYSRGLAAHWRTVFTVGVTAAAYINVFVLLVVGFHRVPWLKALAPNETELPFVLAQSVVLLAFGTLGTLAVKRFRPLAAAAAA